MNSTERIIEELKKSASPMSAGELVEKTGIDRKEVDKAMKVLKDSGRITSPRRCYWSVS
jgi:biotin operon repressor